MLEWDVSALLSEAWTMGSTGLPAFCDLTTVFLDLEDREEIEDWPSSLSLEGEDIVEARKAFNFFILLAFNLTSRRLM